MQWFGPNLTHRKSSAKNVEQYGGTCKALMFKNKHPWDQGWQTF